MENTCKECHGCGLTKEFLDSIGTYPLKINTKYCPECTSGAYRVFFDKNIQPEGWRYGYKEWLTTVIRQETQI